MKKLIYILIPITLFVIFVCTLNIDKQYMWSDEIFSFHAAERILETGKPIYESGLDYGRSGIYHYLLAFSMKLFGDNELGSRILNIPFVFGTWVVISLLIYILINKLKNINHRILISYTGGLLYFISNFSIAMLRETRMYSMSTFFLMLSIYLIYKAIVQPKKYIYIKWFDVKIDLRYALPAIPVLIVALQTQPINLILGVGLILFFTLASVFYKNKKYLLISLLLFILAILLVYIEFDTLNMLVVYNSLSPDWASNSSPLYYTVLTVRNLPFVVFTALLAVYFLFKKGNIHILFLSSIILGFLSFLSFQSAQHERYWQAVIPILFVISVYSIYLLFKTINNKKLKYVLTSVVLLFVGFHIYLSIKEFKEIDTYTPHSLSIHKKLEFEKTYEYININDTNDTLVIGDFHSVYTLYEKGVKIDYLLLTDTDVNWDWGYKDLYFEIPLINMTALHLLSQTSDGYLVVRDSNRFEEIPFEKVEGFNRPVIYRF